MKLPRRFPPGRAWRRPLNGDSAGPVRAQLRHNQPVRAAPLACVHRKRFVALVAVLALVSLSACAPPASGPAPPILLFAGEGTSPNDVRAVETILKARHLPYSKAGTSQLNAMGAAQLAAFRLLIVPGGNYLTIGRHLTPATSTNIQHVVQGGMNYLGICAGAILAGHPAANGFNLTAGVRFDFYAVVNQGIHQSAVPIAVVGAPTIEHYWEDGPQFTGWGAVVGQYPDGTPAIVEGTCGQGFVLLCGVHPEAPQSWRRGLAFTTPASAANDYAGTLIQAALNGTWLPHH